METKSEVNINEKIMRSELNCETTNNSLEMVDINVSSNQMISFEIENVDRSTSPIYKFSMQEFLNNIDSSIDISKINDYEFIEENINLNNNSKNAYCNTFYSNDIYSLSSTNNIQDKKKTKEERKKEREKKKEDDLFKKYQMEQEACNKVIAKSKCGRWVKFNNKIGEGSYKFVYSGYDVDEAKNIAWCEFKCVHVDTKDKRSVVFKETEIMLQLNHPHIVRCFDVLNEWELLKDSQTLDEKGIVIIEELMAEGTLKNMIKKNFIDGKCILKFPLIARWWHQILDALRYMHHSHNLSIIHRDLKSDNCFLFSDTDDNCLNIKIGDFGLATHVKTSERKSMLGTLGFMAPEIYEEKYDESVDIYSFGMLMLEDMTNKTPYGECEGLVQILAKTLTGEDPKVLEQVEDKWLREIINSCIHPLACYRPTAEELYYHPIFQCKNLNVEVELNTDKLSSKTDVINQFLSNIDNCKKMNLRLRFRDKRMLQELGLDDGESLEFDLDIYKDQDIPELIQNLRVEYEDKLSKVYDNPKILDKSTINSNLDKLFLSLELQMKCLVKHLLGRRWKDILNSLVPHKVIKIDDGNDELIENESKDLHKFERISEYKKMWIQAKKLLDKEILVYREISKNETNETLTIEGFNVQSNIENEKESKNIKAVDVTDDTFNSLKLSGASTEFFQRRNSCRRQFQVVTSSQNFNTALDAHDCPNDVIDCDLSMVNIKSMGTIDSDAIRTDNLVLVTDKTISYNIRIQNVENIAQNINVTFVIEIPNMSNMECGKWVLSFKCFINENSNLESFELNSSGIFLEKVDNEINMILQETVQCILKLIQLDQTLFQLDRNYIFYPKEENYFLTELKPKVLVKFRSEVISNLASSDTYLESCGESGKYIMVPDSTQSAGGEQHHQSLNNLKSISDNSSSKELVHENIKTYVESLFQNECAILLIRKTENDNNQIIEAHNIPLGTAFVINDDMKIQNIKKATIISPSVEDNRNVFVRELDKSDLSMDKAINILSLLQEKIEELSTNECNKRICCVINSKVLFETKLKLNEFTKIPSNANLKTEKHLDKQKILEQVLKQKDEIEKLQLQQSQLLALLANSTKTVPYLDHHDIINQQQILNKLNLNQLNNPSFNTENNYFYQYHPQNQGHLNNTDPRIILSNNSIKSVPFVKHELLDYPNNATIDNSFRHQLSGFRESISEGSNFKGKEFHKVDSNNRLNMLNEHATIGNGPRILSGTNYSMDRQIPFSSSEHVSEEIQAKIKNPLTLTQTLVDPSFTNQAYQQGYQYYYQRPFPVYDQMQTLNVYEKSVIGTPISLPKFHSMENTVLKNDGVYNHILAEDIVLKQESSSETQVRNDPISFSNLIANESIKSVYQKTFLNQNFTDKAPE